MDKIFGKTLIFTNKVFESAWFKYVVFIFFIILFGWLKFDHIFERDESQALLIININRNFLELISSLRYEGTTALWYIILWLVSFIIPLTPFSLTVIHFFLIIFFIWYLLFRIDIPVVFKIIFLTNLGVLWHFIYVRQYIAAMLLMLLMINSVIKNKKLIVYVLIAILIQIHVTIIPVAISFWIFYTGKQIINKETIPVSYNLIVALSLILAFFQLLPPPDLVTGLKQWNLDFTFGSFISNLLDLIRNTFCLKHTFIYIIILPAFIVFLLVVSFKSNTRFSIIWIISLLVMVLGFQFIYMVKYLAPHHFYILFFGILTYIIILTKTQEFKFDSRWYLFLIPLMLYTGYIMRKRIADYNYAPFSYSKQVAQYIDKNYIDRTILITPEPFYNGISVYRNEKNTSAFSLGRNKFIKYCVWNHESVDHITDRFLLTDVKKIKEQISIVPDSILNSNPVLIIGSDYPLLFFDENNMEVRHDIIINENLSLKYIIAFEEKSLNYLTEKFVILEIDKK